MAFTAGPLQPGAPDRVATVSVARCCVRAVPAGTRVCARAPKLHIPALTAHAGGLCSGSSVDAGISVWLVPAHGIREHGFSGQRRVAERGAQGCSQAGGPGRLLREDRRADTAVCPHRAELATRIVSFHPQNNTLKSLRIISGLQTRARGPDSHCRLSLQSQDLTHTPSPQTISRSLSPVTTPEKRPAPGLPGSGHLAVRPLATGLVNTAGGPPPSTAPGCTQSWSTAPDPINGKTLLGGWAGPCAGTLLLGKGAY